jgi:hypothetical protein
MKGLYWFSKYMKIRIHDFHMFLFDSFQGMPPANNEQEMGATYEGEFKGSIDTVKQRLNSGKTNVNLHFIQGLFNESLTQELLKTLKEHPPSLVRIDVILFSSAITVLNFIKPILQNGTIVYFQNLEAYLNSLFKGEMNALNNFNKMYEKEKALLWPVQAPFGIQLLQSHAYVYSSLDENAIPKI